MGSLSSGNMLAEYHTIKGNTAAQLDPSKEVGLEVNTE
jgi:hypothetical protein